MSEVFDYSLWIFMVVGLCIALFFGFLGAQFENKMLSEDYDVYVNGLNVSQVAYDTTGGWMLSSCWDGCVYSDWYVHGTENRTNPGEVYHACADLCLDRSAKGRVLNKSQVREVLSEYNGVGE